MNRLFRTTVVETSGVRTISGGGTNASNAGQALLNLSGVSLTGDQTIGGIKTFASRPTFNGTGVLVSGDSVPAITANYITVTATNNSVTNGTNLLQAYATAKTTLPNGSALSATNRLAIILPPAIYDLGTQSLILDTQYIDIIGSTPDRSKHYIKNNVGAVDRGTVQQTANNVKLYNLTIENVNNTFTRTSDLEDPAAYFPDNDLNNTYLENINFIGNANVWSSRFGIEYSGTFINCTGGDHAFGGGGTASGTFKDCTGGDYAFGGEGGFASGAFTNCTGENYAFGGDGGVANGAFTNCTGGTGAFESTGGTFTNCTAGGESFNSTGVSDGTFTNCTGGIYSFGGDVGTADGTYINCTGGDYSFGGSGTASGIFKDCTGGNNAFGGDGGVASGAFTNCIGGIGTFGGETGTASGTFKDCTGGDGAFGGDHTNTAPGVASGTFTNCTGGNYAFGGDGTARGIFKDCAGGSFAFGGSGGVASGTFTNCTGGSFAFGGNGGTIRGIFKDCTGGENSFNL